MTTTFSGKTASRVQKKDAMDYVGGYTVALDMTARDWQNDLKSQGYPWFLAKSFDTSCPVAGFIEKSKVADPHQLELGKNIKSFVSWINSLFSLHREWQGETT